VKKILSAFLIVLFAAPVFSAWWDGGTVRMMSLGNISTALPDATSVVDLYSQGFSSFLAYRKWADVASTSGLYDKTGKNFFGSENNTAVTDFSDGTGNYIMRWYSPYDAVVIQPEYLNAFIPSSAAFGGGADSWNSGGTSVQYAHLFGYGISGGAMVKYATEYETSEETIWVGMGTPLNTHKHTIRDYEFLVDAGYRVNDNLFFAVSGGKTVPPIYVKNPPNLLYNAFSGFDFLSFDENGYSGSGVSTGGGHYIDYTFNTNGVNLNAGMQYIKEGSVEAVVSGGVIEGYRYDYNQLSDVIGSGTMTQKGTAYNAAIKLRFFPARGLTAAFSATGSGLDYSWDNGPKHTSYISDITAGVCYQSWYFRVPVEIFGHVSDGYWLYSRYAAIRGGIEWDAASWLTLRAGADWPGITEFVRDYSVDYIYEYTAGLGLNLGRLKADFGISYGRRDYSDDFSAGDNFRNYQTTFGINVKMLM
jgi:hypothetical protein